uniref:NADH dehydrogenase subunit 4 n=1 Tax=Chrysanthemum morifolium TaxID=41568 RepID=A0A7T0CR95_CHRMO|nr:NADH dehydrogenase subunit 4 [Chrysanthemum x morifolium]USH92456.1 NADH dehydrogenase subunit 4 [Chrysanthemum indicum]QPJ79720.1 NADH dehydrogenase subunit 4 [Chrysanthemum x morifolium]USH91128.1 NADH dehydrogenase subunit 4 [Chrysanthemum x morifolium]USH91211.1 NADH dehydrogenase subunit 4 [Chrysanthemum x morifolium]
MFFWSKRILSLPRTNFLG